MLLQEVRKLREEVKTGQEDTARKLARSGKKDPYTFKRKANEMQHRFNEDVAERVEEAEAALDRVGTSSERDKEAVERVKEVLKEGKQLIAHRQKLLKLADRSEHGWTVVEEYEEDGLADDSEDEKRIEKAERAAERRIQAKRRKEAALTGKKGMPQEKESRPQALPRPASEARPYKPPAFAPGICFQCGELGHLRRDCPKRLPVSAFLEVCEHVSDTWQGVDSENVTPVEESVGGARCWEVQSAGCIGEAAERCSVKGRLGKCAQFWREELSAPPWVIDTITEGYVLPLMSEPPRYSRPNQQSAHLVAEFVSNAVSDLLAGGYVERVSEPPSVCSPLSVVVSGSCKKRLVVNLRHVNQYLWKQKFKYEDLRVAMMMFNKGELMFAFDLKSGYHHVEIVKHHRRFLGFHWDNVYYTFTVLPFGLSSAPYAFTKLMRPVVRYWRCTGLKAVVYLDDGLCAVKGKEEACAASQWVQSTLQRAGLVVNESKSTWHPSHVVQWLGFVVDLEQGCISVPVKKVDALKAKLGAALDAKALSARQLASLVGKIISMGLALGPISRFMTRSMNALLQTRFAWCSWLELSVEARTELQFWVESLQDFNAQPIPIWRSPGALRVVYSDASSTGYGGYTVEHGMHVVSGVWSPEEAKQSSTWRELVAVKRVLLSVVDKLNNSRIRWFTDNQNVARILMVGSGKGQLQAEALKIFALSMSRAIHIEPEWIPREQNEIADYISRIVDYDDWFINPAVFAWVNEFWGPHTVDRFANNYNTQLPRFNSRFLCPRGEAVDAFTVDWSGENNWWCPPPVLIPRVVRHAELCKASGTLVVPCWESAPYWPLLCPSGEGFASFVVDYLPLPMEVNTFCPGRSGAVLFNGKAPNSAVFALRVEFG